VRSGITADEETVIIIVRVVLASSGSTIRLSTCGLWRMASSPRPGKDADDTTSEDELDWRTRSFNAADYYTTGSGNDGRAFYTCSDWNEVIC
jgi:hypothetical protein